MIKPGERNLAELARLEDVLPQFGLRLFDARLHQLAGRVVLFEPLQHAVGVDGDAGEGAGADRAAAAAAAASAAILCERGRRDRDERAGRPRSERRRSNDKYDDMTTSADLKGLILATERANRWPRPRSGCAVRLLCSFPSHRGDGLNGS